MEIDNGNSASHRNLIRFDWALKRLLRNRANFEVLEGFLTVLLGERVTIRNIGESDGNKTGPDDKYNRVDILTENDRNELFLIELQIDSQADYFHRMLYGVSKAVTESLKQGEGYIRIGKVYHINIVYFGLGQGKDYVYHGRNDFYGIHHHDLLQLNERQRNLYQKTVAGDLFPEYYILRVNDFNDVARDGLDEWMYYLKNDRIPDEFTAPGLAMAREKLLYDRLSDREKREYDRHRMNISYEKSAFATSRDEGIDLGRKEGIDLGRKEGIDLGRKEGEEEREKLKRELEENEKKLEERDREIAELRRLLDGR
ncbi:MAG: Rpn family recombination-promoting nuclease/putative transposase [Tannerella sp.]|jgi:predicted transposase/invertase (TIGR01784 family)|nr:Rpn family recombination-promoting nuclease/putative transposase [Tannerella sp.]